ncbi:MAG: hypothetical protein AABY27_05950 [Pseudomonadota bacterium]
MNCYPPKHETKANEIINQNDKNQKCLKNEDSKCDIFIVEKENCIVGSYPYIHPFTLCGLDTWESPALPCTELVNIKIIL